MDKRNNRNAYQRYYYAKNIEKKRANQRERRRKYKIIAVMAELIGIHINTNLTKQKEYYKRNKSECINKQKEYYKKHRLYVLKKAKIYRDKLNDKVREYQKEWRAKNKEHYAEYQKEYRLKNKAKLNANCRYYYHRKKTEAAKKAEAKYREMHKERVGPMRRLYSVNNQAA